MRFGKHWLCNAIKPGEYPIYTNIQTKEVVAYMKVYEPFVEWFGGRLVVYNKCLVWQEWSGIYNFIIYWRKGFLFRTWNKWLGEIIIRIK